MAKRESVDRDDVKIRIRIPMVRYVMVVPLDFEEFHIINFIMLINT